ncbi:MAG: InlB B-repeat-containing protein [Acholeplasmataceae bacterium]|nr:InlB B-repeat-containing protein [Acholeplasmataceae bacterium]
MKRKSKLIAIFGFLLFSLLLLSACVETVKYTVYFESNGGSDVDSTEVIENGLLEEPNDPTRENYNFKGWYKDSQFNEKFDFDIDVITGNVTLYARWEEVPYQETDEDKVLEAKNALTLGNVHNVTSDLELPIIGINDVTISWSSGNEEYLRNDGTITRPEYNEGNIVVELTATLKLNDAETTKTFSVTILKETKDFFYINEIYELTSQQLVTVEGYVSALSDRRMVIQDENGLGIYLWLSGVKDELFGTQEINLGDKVKVRGEFKASSPIQIDVNNTTSGYFIERLEGSQEIVKTEITHLEIEELVKRDFNELAGGTYTFKGVEIIENSVTAQTGRIIFLDKFGKKLAVRIDGNMLPMVKQDLIDRELLVGEIVDLTMTFYGVDNGNILSGILSSVDDIEENDKTILYYALSKLNLGNINEVTQNLNFLETIIIEDKEVALKWTSSAEDLISNEGVVVRPIGNDEIVVVELELTLDDSDLIIEVEFNIVGDIPLSEKFSNVKDGILFEDEYVANFTLPLTGNYEAIIRWESLNTEVVNIDGDLALVMIPDNDTIVELKAYIKIGDSEEFEASFEVMIPSIEITDEYVVAYVLDLINFEETNLVENLDLTVDSPFLTEITWSSNSPFLKDDGKVIRPLYEDENVTFTATVKYGEYEESKSFELVVKELEGHLASDFYDLGGGYQVLKGLVAGKSSTRLVIQDEEGRGFYIWMNTAQVNHFASGINVGDLIIASGTKDMDANSQLPQLSVNNLTDAKKYVKKIADASEHPYELAAPVVINNEDDLPEDYEDLQGGRYQFINFVVLAKNDKALVIVDDENQLEKIVIRYSGNATSEVIAKINPILKGDVVTFTGTFYSRDGKENMSLIISFPEDIEVVNPLGKFALIKDDIKPYEEIEEELVLKADSLYNSTITWTSNDEAITIVDGVITINRPVYPAGDKTVELTAEVKLDEFSETYTYEVTVLQELSAMDKVLEAKNNLGLDLELDEVILDFELPLEGLHGTTILWESSNSEIVEIDGSDAIVTRPFEEDKEVILTATIKLNDEELTKEFVLTVLAGEMADEEKVQYVIDNFELDSSNLVYDDSEEVYLINGDITLVDALFGVTVSWDSSNVNVLTNDGLYKEPFYQELIILTAKFSLNDVEEEVIFNLETIERTGYLTPKEVLGSNNNGTYNVRGIIAVKTKDRMIIQQPEGDGIYVWLGGYNANNTLINNLEVGDFITMNAKLTNKETDEGKTSKPQLGTIKDIVLIGKEYEIVYEEMDSADFQEFRERKLADVMGRVYLFKNVVINATGTSTIHFYNDEGKTLGLYPINNTSNDFVFPEFVNGDVYNILGTIYGGSNDDVTGNWNVIITSLESLEKIS